MSKTKIQAKKRRFYTFDQNNSGGHFDFDETKGITHYVIIEAITMGQALDLAEEIGIYFNGCEDGRDCECCGDRWYKPWSDNSTEVPTVYNQEVGKGKFYQDSTIWMPDGKEICIHYLDGKKVWVKAVKGR